MNREFNLDDLLGPEYVAHYQRVLNSATRPGPGTGAGDWGAPQLAAPDYSTWDASYFQREAAMLPGPGGEDMIAQGCGPDWCSSSTVLSVVPEIVWDVCGYYALLGVHWSAGRKQLRLAYLAVNPDNASEEIHFAMMILMDPVLRRAYDLTPLGGVFIRDRRTEENLKRAAAREAARQVLAGNAEVTDKDVLRQWGVEKVSPEESRRRLAQDPQAQPMREGSSLGAKFGNWHGRWTWYLLAPDSWDPPSDASSRLEEWQQMLVTAFAALGEVVRFSVGLHDGPGTRSWQGSRQSCIFFLGNEHPTQDMADEAASRVKAHRTTRRRRNASSYARR